MSFLFFWVGKLIPVVTSMEKNDFIMSVYDDVGTEMVQVTLLRRTLASSP